MTEQLSKVLDDIAFYLARRNVEEASHLASTGFDYAGRQCGVVTPDPGP